MDGLKWVFMVYGLWFGVESLGVGVQSSGFLVQGSGFWSLEVQSAGSRVWGSMSTSWVMLRFKEGGREG